MGKLLRFVTSVAMLGSLSAQPAAATVSSDTFAVCDALFAQYPQQLEYDPLGPKGLLTIGNSSAYATANTEYWNAKSSDNRAACAFLPSNAEDVSFAVQTLCKYPTVSFATKCAGHNPNLGWSSVADGVLISFRPNSQYVIPSSDGYTVDVGAGAKWQEVYKTLEPLNKVVVGGRLGDIGVTGFTIGGGLSYLSSQYGLAADNVVSFEVVLANGTITTANSCSNPDLFFALRGGGNQYAIVTKMTLKTHPIGDNGMIWGGTRSYSADQSSAVLAAISNFIASNEDTKAALIPTFDYYAALGISIPSIMVFFFYDAATPPPGIFDSFDAIPALIDDVKTTTYYNLTQEAFAGKIEGLRFQIRMNTFPNMPLANMSSFLEEHFEMVTAATKAGALADLVDLQLFTSAVQPLSHLITKASADAGGNALGLTPESGDRVWIEYDLAWGSAACDTDCPASLEKLANSLHDLHVEKYSGIYPTNYQSGDLGYIRQVISAYFSYNPIFMNDAMYDQQVLQSYGDENYQRLKSVHEAYDPTDFFSTRQNGWVFNT